MRAMWVGLAGIIGFLFFTSSCEAGFVNGVENFAGTSIDTINWEAYPDVPSLSQNNGLTIDTRFNLPTTPKIADLTSVYQMVGIGQTVSVVASILQRGANGNTPSLSVFLTTNSNGSTTPTGNDTHWLGLFSNPTTISDSVGANGSGFGHTLIASGQPLSEANTFQIERLTQTSARFRVFNSQNVLLITNTETFSGVPDSLFVAVQTSSVLGNFQSVTIVPEPGFLGATAMMLLPAMGIRRSRQSRREVKAPTSDRIL